MLQVPTEGKEGTCSTLMHDQSPMRPEEREQKVASWRLGGENRRRAFFFQCLLLISSFFLPCSYHYPGVSNNIAIAPETMIKLAQHPNIVGCKLSHGNLDDLGLVALSPKVDHQKFRTFTGLGQVLLPVLTLNGAGAIDGLASMFPKTVVRIFNLFEKDSLAALTELRVLQQKVAAGEKMVGKWGVIGVKEGISRLRGFGDRDGGRVPLQGGYPAGDAEWAKWTGVLDELEAVEKSL